MFGWIAAAHQMGGAFAAWGAGYLRTETGNYLSAFMTAGLLCLSGSVMVQFIGRFPRRNSIVSLAPTD
jgi:hypothetical protein